MSVLVIVRVCSIQVQWFSESVPKYRLSEGFSI
jgi:hypothetical protein